MLEAEVDSLTPSRPFSRRDFVAASVGSGFAAAVLPVSAQTIKTPTDGLIARTIGIPTESGFTLPGYGAVPGDPHRRFG